MTPIANTSNPNHVLTPKITLPEAENRFVLFMAGTDATLPTSASINGLEMTLFADSGAHDEKARIWGLVIPNSWVAGAYTVTGHGEHTQQRWWLAGFSGVAKDPVVDADGKRGGSATEDSSSLTVDCVDGGWVHDVIFAYPAKTAGAGQTVIYNVEGNAGISYKSNLTEGTATMYWTWTDSRWAHAVVSLRPAKASRGIIMF